MGDVSSEENQVKILLEEYKVLREEILHKISAHQKNVYIFASITLILCGLGVQGDLDQIFVLLPFVIAAGHLLIVEDLKWLCRLAKYNQVIEEKINMLLDVDYKIVYWEHLAGDWSQENTLYQLIYNTILYLPVILICGYSAHKGAQYVDAYYENVSMYNGCIFIYIILFIFCVGVAIYNIFIYNKEISETVKSKMNL